MNSTKVIFFDMGNTLLHFHYGKSDYEKDVQGLTHLTRYLNKFNSNIILDEVKEVFYKSWMDGIKDRKETYREYPIDMFLNNFLKKYNINLDLQQCIEAINEFYTDYREAVYFEEDIYGTLTELKNKGYKIGVISNTCYYDEVMIECFKKAKIYNLIDSFTFSYSLRIGKPNKKIFIEAIDKMKITPEEAIMVGDSLEKDIRPAIELGMKTIWLNSNGKSIDCEVKPHFEIKYISEVINFV